MKPVDYKKFDYYNWRHHERFKRFVLSRFPKLTCQNCHGRGGEIEIVCEFGGPWVECGWCEGTGFVTPYARGMWLRFKKEDKHDLVHFRHPLLS